MLEIEKNRRFYRDLLKLNVTRESALNIVLVRMGLKDATTTGYSKELNTLLKKNGFLCELDESYLVKSIHGFVEHTTKTPLPGASVVRRLYVARTLSRIKLKKLKTASDFEQALLFGFPMCDILNYCRKVKIEGKGYIDIFADWLAQIPSVHGFKNVDFRLMGGLVKYSQSIRILVHIPCQSNCAASLELAERNLNILGQLDAGFKEYLVGEFRKPILLYANRWEDIGIVQLTDFKRHDANVYDARCVSMLPPLIFPNTQVRITLIPHREVEVNVGNKKIIKQGSKKRLECSYCFIFPYDSLTDERAVYGTK